MYIYGLDEAETKKKVPKKEIWIYANIAQVVEIFECVQKVFPQLYVAESKNTFTMFATGLRCIQVITTYVSLA
jgi:hypothetical protein